ncbi:MAG TPA: S53 family peptidase [Kofleriaceae bacterium]
MLGHRWSLFVLVVLALASDAAASPSSVTLGGHRPRWATAANDRGSVGERPLGHLTVRIARSAEKQRAFDALLAAQQTIGSPSYHQWLTATQIGERFGASDADIAQVTGWLRTQGFTITNVGHSRTFVELSGSTSIASRAFGVEFHDYAFGSRTLMSIDREPSIPAKLATLVAGIGGLHQRVLEPALVKHGTGTAIDGQLVTNTGFHLVGVSDFATIYDLAPAYNAGITGAGQTIGIIGRARVLPADITNFGARMGVTMPAVNVVIPPSTGVDPGTPCGSNCENDDQLEATLDVERAGSIALGAKIDLIVSGDSQSDDGLDIALTYAVDSSSDKILNLSFAGCEANDNASGSSMLDMFWQQAAMQGQSVFVASGDAGADTCEPQGMAPDPNSYPQIDSINDLGASSYVTCVGGTEFADASALSTYWDGNGAAMSYIPEGVWNDSHADNMNIAEGGGGGVSVFVAKPTFQNGVGSPTETMRMVPDLALNAAAANDPYLICAASYQGADCVAQSDGSFLFGAVGGTSASAPDMAAVTALIDQAVGTAQGNINPNLYMLGGGAAASSVFHDITVASSGVANCSVDTPSMCNNSDPGPTSQTVGAVIGYQVGPGYDEATGWGSVDVAQLISHWPGAQLPMLTINPTSLTVLAGKSGTVTLAATGFSGTPTFSCGAGLPSNATCSFSGTTLTITAAGTAAGVTDVSSGTPRGRWLLIIPCALALLLRRRRNSRRTILALAFVTSCGGTSSDTNVDAAPPVTSTVTITATSAAQSASAMLSLTTN